MASFSIRRTVDRLSLLHCSLSLQDPEVRVGEALASRSEMHLLRRSSRNWAAAILFRGLSHWSATLWRTRCPCRRSGSAHRGCSRAVGGPCPWKGGVRGDVLALRFSVPFAELGFANTGTVPVTRLSEAVTTFGTLGAALSVALMLGGGFHLFTLLERSGLAEESVCQEGDEKS